jgi:hypothetical protein
MFLAEVKAWHVPDKSFVLKLKLLQAASQQAVNRK